MILLGHAGAIPQFHHIVVSLGVVVLQNSDTGLDYCAEAPRNFAVGANDHDVED